MWTNILNSTDDPTLQSNAINRLLCLRVDSDVKLLEARVDQFTKQNGHPPSGWPDLISAGMLRGVPLDPKGFAYRLSGGRVQVAQADLFPFITRGLPPGREIGDLPGESGFRIIRNK
jgi:hypothetical protein